MILQAVLLVGLVCAIGMIIHALVESSKRADTPCVKCGHKAHYHLGSSRVFTRCYAVTLREDGDGLLREEACFCHLNFREVVLNAVRKVA